MYRTAGWVAPTHGFAPEKVAERRDQGASHSSLQFKTKSGDEVLRNILGGPGFQDRLKVPGVLQDLERKPLIGGEEHLDDLVIVLLDF